VALYSASQVSEDELCCGAELPGHKAQSRGPRAGAAGPGGGYKGTWCCGGSCEMEASRSKEFSVWKGMNGQFLKRQVILLTASVV
jgi:hypothetical protein